MSKVLGSSSHAFARGMAALLAVTVFAQLPTARASVGDMFSIPAPALGADPPKAADVHDGDTSVSTQTGAVSYSYPIRVPPGRNGMAPQLALAYSSQAPTYGGIAAGWSLSVPIIQEDHSQGRLRTRSSQVEAEQVFLGQDPKTDDRFVSSLAGGRPLVEVTEPGIPLDAGVYRRYRAQSDTSYTRYERMAPGWTYRWRALTSDGITMEFGEAGLMQGCDAPIDQYAPLTRTRDRFGNEVRYEYGSWEQGECRLLRVVWGQNATAGVADFARLELAWSRGVICNGITSNAQSDYRSGRKIVTGASALLSLTATAYAPGVSTTPVHTRKITLSYESGKEACGLGHAPLRSLASIQESAWGNNAPLVNLPPVTFTYNAPTVNLTSGTWASPWGLSMGVNYANMPANLGWGYRRTDDRGPTVETMFADMDGDGLQDIVANASTSSECRMTWRRNRGPGQTFGPESAPITLPRLKWHNVEGNPTQDAPSAIPGAPYYEGCALNGQITTFTNSADSWNQCHVWCETPSGPCAPAQACQAGSYTCPGGTECPGGSSPLMFRTNLAYRWLDADSDGLTDLVAAIHGDINMYDPELGNRTGHQQGETPRPGIPGFGQWPGCPVEPSTCHQLGDCLDERQARTCGPLGCTVDWNVVNTCVAQTQAVGCATVMAKLGGVVGEPPTVTSPSGKKQTPYTRCGGLYPWLIYKNQGNGVLASNPDIKYQPIPLESAAGDSSFGGPAIASTNHAYMDFDGDGWNDAIVRETSPNTDNPSADPMPAAWQVWLGDGTGGVSPQRYVFPTREANVDWGAQCDAGDNAINAICGTWGADVTTTAGLLDVNGDGAQDHWVALQSSSNANIAFHGGDMHLLYDAPSGPDTGETNTFTSPPIRPSTEVFVKPTDANGNPITATPGQPIEHGRTRSRVRMADVDHDGRVDVLRWPTDNDSEIPQVHWNLGGQFRSTASSYPSDPTGARRRVTAAKVDPTIWTWKLEGDLLDLDGDGIEEALSWGSTGFTQMGPASNQPPRLLATIKNGRGLETQIKYAQMHSATVDQDPAATWFDGRPKASPRAQWVVAEMVTLDAFPSTASATTTYHYKHPRYGADDEGHYSFRGFEEVITTSPGPTGAANGKRTVQRYDYEVDWSGRLAETLVMPSVAEGPAEVRSIQRTTWGAHTLFGGALTTFHAAVDEKLTCSNGQTEAPCLSNPAGRTVTTSTWKAYPLTGPAANQLLYAETNTLLQAGTSPADGDRSTDTLYQLDVAAARYLFHPSETTRAHRVAGAWVTFAKSASTWDPVYGTQLTSETWVDAVNGNRAIARTEYDNTTGNVYRRWKPEQNATGGPALTLTYDARKLFVATETNELGHVREFQWEYGTGTKVQTDGPNARSCTTTCPPAGPSYPLKEQEKLDIDGLGRTLARWITFGNDGSVYTLTQVERMAYADGSMTTPASTTREAVIETGVTTPRWTKETTLLDGHGRPTQTTNFVFGSAAGDAVTTYQYAGDGGLVAVSMPDPSLPTSVGTVTYTYGHDSLGRPTWIRRPDGASPQSGVDIHYDGLTQTTTEFVGGDGGVPATTTTINDAYGRLQYVDEHDGGTTWRRTQYTYGPDDLVSSVTDPQGVKTALGHDWAGHRIRITRPGGAVAVPADTSCMGLVGTATCRHWIVSAVRTPHGGLGRARRPCADEEGPTAEPARRVARSGEARRGGSGGRA
ncbi:MAG: toxin TcdB middle/N-terminal domain-containing protein, partial [Kofleriaceae bacterium]|nr:toxin TcdB middle/N-terminal domain-containing protein [Kofleriaceae bacterium]